MSPAIRGRRWPVAARPASARAAVPANISSTVTGTLSNTATVTAPAGTTDPNLGNNTATDTDTLTPQADLSISKVDNKGGSSITASIGTVVPGTSLIYTIVVANNGPSVATGATVVEIGRA